MLVKEVVGEAQVSLRARSRAEIYIGRSCRFVYNPPLKAVRPRARRPESVEAARESRRAWVGPNLKHSKQSNAHGCPRQPALTFKEE